MSCAEDGGGDSDGIGSGIQDSRRSFERDAGCGHQDRIRSGERAKTANAIKADGSGRSLLGGGGKCMVRRRIASQISVVGGLVCSNVSGLFVEPSSWP